nr:ATP-binding protein [Leucobacter sp. L43]
MELISVIGNLLDNAIDAAATSSIRSREVALRMRAGAPGEGVIDVSDSGDGFSGEARSGMFEWGVSTKRLSTDREVEGRGVGLALVARIVHECGGTIIARESPTTFTVRLPSARTERSPRRAASTAAPATPPGSPPEARP